MSLALAALVCAPASTQTVHHVRGVVAASGGSGPIAGATIVASDLETRTGPNGGFVVGLPAGPHDLHVSADGWAVASFSLTIQTGMPDTVDLGLIVLDAVQPVRVELSGTVTDAGTDVPISHADLFINGNMVAASDDAGRFRSAVNLVPGPHLVLVRSVGYRMAGYELTVVEGGPVQLNAALAPQAFMLPGITVTQTEISGRLNGFVRRMDSEIGQFLTPSDVERIRERVLTTSDLLARVPGIRLRPSPRGNVVSVARCGRPELFLDGSPVEVEFLDEFITVDQILAVEVYSDPARIPAQFNRLQPRRSVANYGACGAIILWTRSG